MELVIVYSIMHTKEGGGINKALRDLWFSLSCWWIAHVLGYAVIPSKQRHIPEVYNRQW